MRTKGESADSVTSENKYEGESKFKHNIGYSTGISTLFAIALIGIAVTALDHLLAYRVRRKQRVWRNHHVLIKRAEIKTHAPEVDLSCSTKSNK